MDGWNTTFLLGRPIFSGYVSFREGKGQMYNIILLSIQRVCCWGDVFCLFVSPDCFDMSRILICFCYSLHQVVENEVEQRNTEITEDSDLTTSVTQRHRL